MPSADKTTQTDFEPQWPDPEMLRQQGKVLVDAQIYHELQRAMAEMANSAIGTNPVETNEGTSSPDSSNRDLSDKEDDYDEESSVTVCSTADGAHKYSSITDSPATDNAHPNRESIQISAQQPDDDSSHPGYECLPMTNETIDRAQREDISASENINEPNNAHPGHESRPTTAEPPAIGSPHPSHKHSTTKVESPNTIDAQPICRSPSAIVEPSNANNEHPAHRSPKLVLETRTIDQHQSAINEIELINCGIQTVNDARKSHQPIPSMVFQQINSQMEPQRIRYRSHSLTTPRYCSTIPPRRRLSSGNEMETDKRTMTGATMFDFNIKFEGQAAPLISPPLIDNSTTIGSTPSLHDTELTTSSQDTIIEMFIDEVHDLGPNMEQKLLDEARARGVEAEQREYSPETEAGRKEAAQIQKELDEENDLMINCRFTKYRPSDNDSSSEEEQQQGGRGRGRGRGQPRPPLPRGMSYKKKAQTQPAEAIRSAQPSRMIQPVQTAQLAQAIQLAKTTQLPPASSSGSQSTTIAHQQQQSQTIATATHEAYQCLKHVRKIAQIDDEQGAQASTSTGVCTTSGHRLNRRADPPIENMPPGRPSNQIEQQPAKQRIVAVKSPPRSPSPHLLWSQTPSQWPHLNRSPTPPRSAEAQHRSRSTQRIGNRARSRDRSRSFGSWGEAAALPPDHNHPQPANLPPEQLVNLATNQPSQLHPRIGFRGDNYCHICRINGHKTHQCLQWREGHPAQRYLIADQNGLCHNCFRASHQTEDCNDQVNRFCICKSRCQCGAQHVHNSKLCSHPGPR